MIKSMTGYGRFREVVNDMEISFEIKSVNSRYLDIYVKVPRMYSFLEEKIKSLTMKYISRGKVEINLYITDLKDRNIKITLNDTYLENYIEMLHKLKDKYLLPDDITVMRIAQNRDIFNVEKLEEDEEEIWQAAKTILENALFEFDAMRTEEGNKLYNDMSSRILSCSNIIDEINLLSEASKENYYNTLKQKIDDILKDAGADENRIITEAAIYADKIAVDEEITRIKSHFSQFIKFTKEKTPSGRKIDFLIQEMNREINTIGSKSLDINITNYVVEVKSEIEKIREQIQNIE